MDCDLGFSVEYNMNKQKINAILGSKMLQKAEVIKSE